jgi:hypothetical protein
MNITIQNLETGIVYDEFICPEEILETAEDAIKRGQASGMIYGAGDRWSWRVAPEAPVRLEFTRDGEVECAFDIPKTSWQAFQLVAAKNGVAARDYLAFCVANCLSEGDPLEEVIEWLFSVAPTRSPEVTRFDSASERFHRGEIRTMRLPDNARWEDLA